MNKLSKLIWVGLIVNAALLGAVCFFSASAKDIYSELSYSERDLVDVVSLMKIPFIIALAMQIVSLPVLFKVPKAGLTLAIISSLVMLPLSLVFMTGYLFSYEKQCNKNLTLLPQSEKNTLTMALSFKTSQLLMQGLLFIALGLFVCFFSGMATGWLVVGAGVLSSCNSFRLKNRTMIGMSQDKLVITPGLFADTYLVPLSDVTLIKEDKRLFKLHIKSAGIDRKCTFRKGLIKEDNYPVVLEGLLSKLTKQE
ncbi:MAG: hypothetical protein WAU54_17645 [Chania sp.]